MTRVVKVYIYFRKITNRYFLRLVLFGSGIVKHESIVKLDEGIAKTLTLDNSFGSLRMFVVIVLLESSNFSNTVEIFSISIQKFVVLSFWTGW